jgi:predicted secreted protein/heat shock protein HslJ
MRAGIKMQSMVLMLTAVVGLSGCGDSRTQSTLEGDSWELAAYGDREAPQDALSAAMVTALFDAKSGKVSGTGGCNTFGGNYSATYSHIAISDLVALETYCETPEGIMAQETAFLSLLEDAQKYDFRDEALHIECANDKLLVFNKRVELTLTEDENGSSIAMERGQYLLLSLASNPSTGFGWELNGSVAPVLQQIGESVYEPSESGAIGGGGTETFRFKAAEPGETALRLIYRQPWVEEFLYSFDVNVTVH